MKARLLLVVCVTAVLLSFPAFDMSAKYSTVYGGHQQAGGKYCAGDCSTGQCSICFEDCTGGALVHKERKQAPGGVDPGAGDLLIGLGLLLLLRLKMML
jgi:hypothetical protein